MALIHYWGTMIYLVEEVELRTDLLPVPDGAMLEGGIVSSCKIERWKKTSVAVFYRGNNGISTSLEL